MSDIVKRNLDWFAQTGQIPDGAEPNPAQAAFYTGMQMEELAEKLQAVFGKDSQMARLMHEHANLLKSGKYDEQFGAALGLGKAGDMLDADIDLLWVSLGGAKALGSNVHGAWSAVALANEAKRFPDGAYHRDPVSRKVLKPEGWAAPELGVFLHPALRQEGSK